MEHRSLDNIHLLVARTLKQEVSILSAARELEPEAVLRCLLARYKRAPWATMAYRALSQRVSRVLPLERRAYGSELVEGTLKLILFELESKARHPDRSAADWFEVVLSDPNAALKALMATAEEREVPDER